jgi:AsmA family
MKKLLVRILIGLVVLVILVVLAVGLFLDGAIKKGVETIGPRIAKVDIKLDSVNLSLLSGSAKIKGLVVGNPEGYKTPNAISVGSTSVSVSPGSLLSDKIIVKSIRVESPEITFEGGLTGNNLKQIMDNVNASVGGGETAAPTETAPKETKPGKKLQVDDFLITGAKVKVSLKGTDGFAAPVPIPDIHFTNLGDGPDGITPAELTKKVLSEVTADAIKAAAGAVTDIGKGAVNEATKDVGKATKSITDLFKKKN